jgi:flagellar biosynthesis protein FlhF
MMIRRYIVKDIPEAVVMIRRDLGKDAVILNTKKVWTKRWLGLWRTRRVEVVAATGDDVPRKAAQSSDPQMGYRTQQPSDPQMGYRTQQPSDSQMAYRTQQPSVHQTAQTSQYGNGQTGPRSVAAVQQAPETATPVFATGTGQYTQQPGFIRTAGESGMQPRVSPASTTESDSAFRPLAAAVGYSAAETRSQRYAPEGIEEVQMLWNEISELKQKLNRSEKPSAPERGYPRLRQHLLAQGVSPTRVDDILKKCELLSDASSRDATLLSFEAMRQTFVSVVVESLGNLAQTRPISADSRIIGFVGPTGVGKTTTIAKLAALHVLEGKRKVGLLTTDTFRIAAVDQLRTYANILNIPLEVVYQDSELETALEALADRDLILVDTAGRNFSNPKHVRETHTLLDALGCDEAHLVLSFTSKPEDLEEIIQSFKDMPVTQVLLTKLDETRSYGGGLNLLLDFRRPLSYITMGQNVPDDIAVASTEKLLRLIAGGARF